MQIGTYSDGSTVLFDAGWPAGAVLRFNRCIIGVDGEQYGGINTYNSPSTANAVLTNCHLAATAANYPLKNFGAGTVELHKCLLNRDLTATELEACSIADYVTVETADYGPDYGATLAPCSGSVWRHAGSIKAADGTPVQRTWRFKQRSTGVVLVEVQSDPVTGAVQADFASGELVDVQILAESGDGCDILLPGRQPVEVTT